MMTDIVLSQEFLELLLHISYAMFAIASGSEGVMRATHKTRVYKPVR
jgi:hypothetical protein